jgi:hypothetical protein
MAEIDAEKLFAELIIKETHKPESYVFEAIKWWKLKNKWKRGINLDDTKAYRMILRKLKKEVYI